MWPPRFSHAGASELSEIVEGTARRLSWEFAAEPPRLSCRVADQCMSRCKF